MCYIDTGSSFVIQWKFFPFDLNSMVILLFLTSYMYYIDTGNSSDETQWMVFLLNLSTKGGLELIKDIDFEEGNEYNSLI